jgi:hypothetical protein
MSFSRRSLVLSIALAATPLSAEDKGKAEETKSPAPVKIDFEEYEAGSGADDLFIIEGSFKFAEEEGGNKILELEPRPLAESGIIFGKSLKGAATVTAKIKAQKKRRSAPRFGIGLHGISGYRFRVVPARNIVELVKSEEPVKSAEFKWTSGDWAHVKLSIEPAMAEGKWVINGWVWKDGDKPTPGPVISLTAEGKPGQGKASIWGTPYSGTPILYDDIVITDQQAAKPAEVDAR